MELAINAREPSGLIAMLEGGPTTEFETLGISETFGGKVEKSKILKESEGAPGTTVGAPLVRAILFSFPEIMIWADTRVPPEQRSNARIEKSGFIERPSVTT
jgi:hypothetical protein